MKYIFLIINFFILSVSVSVFSTNLIVKPKLCIDCKYFTKNLFFMPNKFGKCSLFLKEQEDDDFLVNGIRNIEYYYCSTARNYDSMCGKEGTLYEENKNNICKIFKKST